MSGLELAPGINIEAVRTAPLPGPAPTTREGQLTQLVNETNRDGATITISQAALNDPAAQAQFPFLQHLHQISQEQRVQQNPGHSVNINEGNGHGGTITFNQNGSITLNLTETSARATTGALEHTLNNITPPAQANALFDNVLKELTAGNPMLNTSQRWERLSGNIVSNMPIGQGFLINNDPNRSTLTIDPNADLASLSSELRALIERARTLRTHQDTREIAHGAGVAHPDPSLTPQTSIAVRMDGTVIIVTNPPVNPPPATLTEALDSSIGGVNRELAPGIRAQVEAHPLPIVTPVMLSPGISITPNRATPAPGSPAAQLTDVDGRNGVTMTISERTVFSEPNGGLAEIARRMIADQSTTVPIGSSGVMRRNATTGSMTLTLSEAEARQVMGSLNPAQPAQASTLIQNVLRHVNTNAPEITGIPRPPANPPVGGPGNPPVSGPAHQQPHAPANPDRLANSSHSVMVAIANGHGAAAAAHIRDFNRNNPAVSNAVKDTNAEAARYLINATPEQVHLLQQQACAMFPPAMQPTEIQMASAVTGIAARIQRVNYISNALSENNPHAAAEAMREFNRVYGGINPRTITAIDHATPEQLSRLLDTVPRGREQSLAQMLTDPATQADGINRIGNLAAAGQLAAAGPRPRAHAMEDRPDGTPVVAAVIPQLPNGRDGGVART